MQDYIILYFLHNLYIYLAPSCILSTVLGIKEKTKPLGKSYAFGEEK